MEPAYELADGDDNMHRIAGDDEDEETEFVPVTQPATFIDQSVYIAFSAANCPEGVTPNTVYKLVQA